MAGIETKEKSSVHWTVPPFRRL